MALITAGLIDDGTATGSFIEDNLTLLKYRLLIAFMQNKDTADLVFVCVMDIGNKL